jgi:DUF438 domain-containing protein
MNTPAKKEHPEWMSDDDIAIYDNLVCIGRSQLGKELARNEEYLLEIASMITLKQMKGMLVVIDDPTIVELKRIHKEHQEAGLIFTTPPDIWYASAQALKAPYLDPAVEKEIDEVNAITSNLILKSCEADKSQEDDDRLRGLKKTSNIADEPADDDIKKEWVKLVEPS